MSRGFCFICILNPAVIVQANHMGKQMIIKTLKSGDDDALDEAELLLKHLKEAGYEVATLEGVIPAFQVFEKRRDELDVTRGASLSRIHEGESGLPPTWSYS